MHLERKSAALGARQRGHGALPGSPGADCGGLRGTAGDCGGRGGARQAGRQPHGSAGAGNFRISTFGLARRGGQPGEGPEAAWRRRRAQLATRRPAGQAVHAPRNCPPDAPTTPEPGSGTDSAGGWPGRDRGAGRPETPAARSGRAARIGGPERGTRQAWPPSEWPLGLATWDSAQPRWSSGFAVLGEGRVRYVGWSF